MSDNQTLLLSICSFPEARLYYLQTIRTQAYTLHTQLFERVYLINDYLALINTTVSWYGQQGMEVPYPQNQINCMQNLFSDIMGLLDITQSFVALQLAPAFEQWPALNSLRSLIQLFVGRNNWKEPGPYWTHIGPWRQLASEVYEFGSDALRDIGDLISRVESVANYEGITIGVGSVWGVF